MKKIFWYVALILLMFISGACVASAEGTLRQEGITFFKDAGYTQEISKLSEADDYIYIRSSVSNTTRSVNNAPDESVIRDVYVIAASYEDDALLDLCVVPYDIFTEQNRLYYLSVKKPVTNPGLKIFTWNGLDSVIPFYAAQEMNSVSADNEIKSMTVGETKAYINNLTGKVTAVVESESLPFAAEFAPEFEIASGASISPASGETVDFSTPVTYTVTAENGDTKTYTVSIASYYKEHYGFESVPEGKTLPSYVGTSGTTSGYTDSITLAVENGNRYLVLDDAGTGITLSASVSFGQKDFDNPFELSYRVRYENGAAQDGDTTDTRVNYMWSGIKGRLESGGYPEITAISLEEGTSESALGLAKWKYGTSSASKDLKSTYGDYIGRWIDVRMVFDTENNVTYIIDGITMGTYAASNTFDYLNNFFVQTTSARRQKIMIDDVTLKVFNYSDDIEVLSEDFENTGAFDSWVSVNNDSTTGSVGVEKDGNNSVLKITDLSAGGAVGAFINFDEISGSFELSYRYKTERGAYVNGSEEISYVWNSLQRSTSAGNDTNYATYLAALCPQDLGDDENGVGTMTWQSRARAGYSRDMLVPGTEIGQWCDVRIVYNENGSDYFIEYYINGRLAGNGVRLNDISVNRISFYTSSARKCVVYVDDIKLVKIPEA